MNLMLTTVGAMAAVAKVAYYCADHFGVFNREAKGEAETRSVEVAENQSADVGFLLSRIPVFNGSGYEIWSSMMKTLFLSQDLWDMVDRGYVEEELTIEVLREVRKKDAMALLFILQAIDKSVFSYIAGASKSREAWDALQKKYQGDAQELNRQYSVDESVLPYPADATKCREAWNAAWDAPEQGCKANTKVVEANIIGKELGVFNSNCGFKEGCSENSDSGWGGGRDDSSPVAESAFHSKLKPSEGHGHIDNKRGGIVNGLNNGSEAADYNSKNAKSESASSCTTNATETKEALDAHALQQGLQANTEVKAQPQVGNPSGGCILIKNLDKAIDDRALHAIFSAFGNILSCKLETDASGQSKGYGHMEYDSEEAAREAIEKVNGMLLNHKKVYVGAFVSKQERAKARDMTKSTKVYVANLSESTTKEDLREVFGNFGTIASTVVVRDEDGKSKSFGFVSFKDADDASWSIDVLNGHKFDNKEWCVRRFQNKGARRAKKKSWECSF